MIKSENWNAQLAVLTSEHQNSLLFCWKIRTGLRKGIELYRIKAYADWFFATQFLTHLQKEEQLMIHILGKSDPMVVKSLAQHRRLKRLFLKERDLIKQLNSIEEELETNIRFEENKVFKELRRNVNLFSLDLIYYEEELHQNSEEWDDHFWK